MNIYRPFIKAYADEDSFPYTQKFDVLFTNKDDAIEYAELRTHEHSSRFEEPKGCAELLTAYDCLQSCFDDEKQQAIESAKLKLTIEELKALGLE